MEINFYFDRKSYNLDSFLSTWLSKHIQNFTYRADTLRIGIFMRHIILFLALGLVLTGCDDQSSPQNKEVIAYISSTEKELQEHCNTLNEIEDQKPFYQKKNVYESVIGAATKKGTGVLFGDVEKDTMIGMVTLSDGIRKIIYFKNFNRSTGKKFQDSNIFKEYESKILRIIRLGERNYALENYTYGVCAYPRKDLHKTEIEADKIEKRKRYYGEIETLTRIEQE